METKPDRAAFRSVLAQAYVDPGHSRRIDAIMEVLEPFFRQGDGGEFSLAKREDVNEEKLCEAVNRLIRGSFYPPCTHIEYVSVMSDPCSHVADGVLPRLAHCISRKFGDMLRQELTEDRFTGLGGQLWRCLCEPLWHSFETGKWNEVDWHLRLEMRAVILEVLSYFVGFAVVGDEGLAGMLRPMVEQLSSVSVLGLKRNMSDTVVALVR